MYYNYLLDYSNNERMRRMIKTTLQTRPCARYGEISDELRPYKFNTVIYKGKTLETPWLCSKCFHLEKQKAWKTQYKNNGGA